MSRQNKGVGSAPWVLPHAYDKQEVENARPTVAQHCAKANRCVHDGKKPDKPQKGWVFRVGTWNVDSLTGRAGEVVKVLRR